MGVDQTFPTTPIRDFLVYNDIAVSLRADVVEFTDD